MEREGVFGSWKSFNNNPHFHSFPFPLSLTPPFGSQTPILIFIEKSAFSQSSPFSKLLLFSFLKFHNPI